MKKITLISILIIVGIVIASIINSCTVSKTIAEKSGSQLWGENCIRCHNAPSSAEYSGDQWETIGMHMKLRANLTDEEKNKIVAFLKATD